jgi:hypothetical protein
MPALPPPHQPHQGLQSTQKVEENLSPLNTYLRTWHSSSGKDTKEKKHTVAIHIRFPVEANNTNSLNQNQN